MTIANGVKVTFTSSGTNVPPRLARLRAAMRVPLAIAGLMILAAAYYVGHEQITLMRRGVAGQGRIVGFQTITVRDGGSKSTTARPHPVVELSLDNHPIRFVDWLGLRGEGSVGAIVPVRYLRDQPSVAMIDRPVWNWFPWGWLAAVGMLVFGSAVIGWVRDRSA